MWGISKAAAEAKFATVGSPGIFECQETMTGQLALISWLLDVVVSVILLRQTEPEDELNTLTTQYTTYAN